MCVTYPEGVAGQWNQFEADLIVGTAALIAERLAPYMASQQTAWLWSEGLGIGNCSGVGAAVC
jgi:hypothetical protein